MEIYGVYEGTLHVVLKRSIVELEGASAAQRDPLKVASLTLRDSKRRKMSGKTYFEVDRKLEDPHSDSLSFLLVLPSHSRKGLHEFSDDQGHIFWKSL